MNRIRTTMGSMAIRCLTLLCRLVPAPLRKKSAALLLETECRRADPVAGLRALLHIQDLLVAALERCASAMKAASIPSIVSCRIMRSAPAGFNPARRCWISNVVMGRSPEAWPRRALW